MIVKENAGGRYLIMQRVAKEQRRMTDIGAGPCLSRVRTDCRDTNDAINGVRSQSRIDARPTYSTLMTAPEDALEGLVHTKAIVTP